MKDTNNEAFKLASFATISSSANPYFEKRIPERHIKIALRIVCRDVACHVCLEMIAALTEPPFAILLIYAVALMTLAYDLSDIDKLAHVVIRTYNLVHIEKNALTDSYRKLIETLESERTSTNLFASIKDRYNVEKNSLRASKKSLALLAKLEAALNNPPSRRFLSTSPLHARTSNQGMNEVKKAMVKYLRDKENHGKKLFTIIGEEAKEHFSQSSHNQINPVSPPQYQ